MTRAKEFLENFKPIVEMANLRAKDTGLYDDNYLIYISTKQGSHGPRIKVFKRPTIGDRAPCVIYSISREPEKLKEVNLTIPAKIEKQVKYWISINYVVLMNLWNSNASQVIIGDVLEQLEKTK